MDIILGNRYTALNWARRKGKSTVFALLSFWMTFYNKFPKNSMENFTVVGCVSKENDAAKKLLAAVKQLIYDGDMRYSEVTRNTPNHIRDYFSRKLIEPTNAEQLTWNNKSNIKSFPPTKKVKGWGFSYLFIDEIAYLDPTDEEPDMFYNLTCKPTLAECGGRLSIASTPAGKSGLFYELFDPEDQRPSEFVRTWFKWDTDLGDSTEEVSYKQFVEIEKERLFRSGREALFRQEYEGDFTVTQFTFFDYDDVEKFFDNTMSAQYTWQKSPCSCGIDFGISVCATVITIKTKYMGKIITLYQREFPIGFDNNELMNPANDDSIPRLKKRYNIQWYAPEESSVSDMFVKWCKREGYPVFPYRFGGGNNGTKNTAYHTYRAMLKQGIMKCYAISKLKLEMNTLQEKQEKVNWIISKPAGGSDDSIDSEVYATIPFFEDDGGGWGGMDIPVPTDEVIKFDINSRKDRIDKENIKQQNMNGFSFQRNPFSR
jgi:hypothetical protein